MKNQTDIIVSSFPKDDEKYIVRNFGLIRKNPSPNSSPYLVELILENLDSGEQTVCEVLLTHLLIARIGSVWTNQRKIDSYDVQIPEKYKSVSIKLKLDNTTPPKTKLLVWNRELQTKRLCASEDFERDSEDIISVFTVFVAEDGMQVYIPSLEIFASSYAPRTHEVLHDLCIHSIDSVLSRYISDFETIIRGNDYIYNIHCNRKHADSTFFFLAYLACNNKTREYVSKIRSSILLNRIIKGSREYSWVEVFPYHPTKFEVAATGLFSEEKNIFWVHRIARYAMPSDCIVILPKTGGKEKDGESKEDTGKRFTITDRIDRELDLTDDVDAGRTAGMKYIKSEVEIEIPRESILIKRTRKGKTVSVGGEMEKTEAEKAAATPQSGSEVSKPVASVVMEVEEKDKDKDRLSILIEAISRLKQNVCFFGDDGRCSRSLQLCSLKKGKTFDGTQSRWALVEKSKPRKLLVCEISLSKEFMYVLDIERKNTESYSGIVFKLNHRLTPELLAEIKETISFNKGVFRGSRRGRKKFPVDNYKIFRHYSDKERMKQSIRSLIDSI